MLFTFGRVGILYGILHEQEHNPGGGDIVRCLYCTPGAAIVCSAHIDFSTAPFDIRYIPGGSFTFTNIQTAPFDFDAVGVSTTGDAQVTSFAGFLGIPLQPSTFFTRANAEIGPDTFIQ